MPNLVVSDTPAPESSAPIFSTEGDLRHDGQIGKSRLEVGATHVVRYEATPIGEDAIAEYELRELSKPRTEDLVDATALIADYRRASAGNQPKGACPGGGRKAVERADRRQADAGA
jgi:hypothetical protein